MDWKVGGWGDGETVSVVGLYLHHRVSLGQSTCYRHGPAVHPDGQGMWVRWRVVWGDPWAVCDSHSGSQRPSCLRLFLRGLQLVHCRCQVHDRLIEASE